MRNKGMLLVKALLLLLLAFGIVSFTVPAETAQAASENSTAQKALKKKIKNLYCKYAFADLDDDGINELITYQFGGDFDGEGFDQDQSLVIYKYENGKVKTMFEYSIHGNGPYLGPELKAAFYYRKGNPYVIINEGGDGISCQAVYKADDASESLAEMVDWAIDGDTTYFLGEKSTSAKEYKAFLKSIKDGKKIKVKLKSVSKKITNTYLKKMFKGFYENLWERGSFTSDLHDRSYEVMDFVDMDGDGLIEMVVTLGSESLVFWHETYVNAVHTHVMDYDWYMENVPKG